MMILLVYTMSAWILVSARSTTSQESAKPSEGDMFWGLELPREEYLTPELPFSFDAMEPYIDASTMEIHYSAIFKQHTVRLNELLKKWRSEKNKTTSIEKKSLIDIWRRREELPVGIRKEFAHYAGGYINHLLYFSTMTPNREGVERSPSTGFMELVDRSFHNMTDMKKDFDLVSEQLFGCGWVYLVRATDYSHGEYLTVTASLEEMVPIDNKHMVPILALDLWEHAFFKKYGNNRKEYVRNWWKTVDWVKVERLLNWWRLLEPYLAITHTDL